MIRGSITINLDMSQVGMNLSESSHHLQPGEAVLIQNIDFDDNKSAIVGRHGSITVNTTHNDSNGYSGFDFATHEVYRAIDGGTGHKYLIVAAEAISGSAPPGTTVPDCKKLYILRTSGVAQTGFTTIRTTGGAEFTLDKTARISFCTAYDTTLGKTVVFGTNGVDQPFYGVFTSTVTDPVMTIVRSISAATFTGAGLNDMTRSGTYTGDADLSYRIQIDRGNVAASVDAVAFTGTGLNDATSGGVFTGTSDRYFRVAIDSVGATDTFKWSKNGGSTWDATGVAITGAAQTLFLGVTITFAAVTGHTLNDRWDFKATCAKTANTFKWSEDAGANWGEVYVLITGAAQELSNGVSVTFAAATGHTIGDRWDFTATVDSGIDDMTVTGSYTGGSIIKYAIKINGVGAQDTFTLSTDDGQNYSGTYNCSIAGVSIGNGLTVKAGAITGHVIDDVWKWTASAPGITSFQFGTAGTSRLKTFLPYAWQGRLWAWGINNEVHWSDPDNFTHWIDEGIAGFLDADAQNYQNPPRAAEVLRDRLIIFSLDCIGYINPTNDTDVPFEYVPIVREHGTLAQRTIQPWDSNILFIDKRSPYLFMFTGAQIIPLDPDGKMSNGFEQFLDATDILNTKLSLQGNNLCICFKSRVDSTDPGAAGDRWLATVNLRRSNAAGVPGFPWSMYPVQANDIVFGQEGTDIGSTWFTDAVARTDHKYYVHRFANTLTAVANRFGDFNGVAGNETNVTCYLRTGWMDFAYLMQAIGKRVSANFPFRAVRFYIDGDYEGTPAVGDICKVQYRFNGWTTWRDLPVASVKMAQWAPFDARAYGREIQFQIVFVSKTARPVLYRLGMDIVPLRGYMR